MRTTLLTSPLRGGRNFQAKGGKFREGVRRSEVVPLPKRLARSRKLPAVAQQDYEDQHGKAKR